MAIDTTRQLIEQIKNATQIGENTAARVGGAMEAILDDIAPLAASSVSVIPNYNTGQLNTILNTFVRWANGTTGTLNSWRASDFIDCSGVVGYVVTGFSATATISVSVGVAVFYDSAQTYISGVGYVAGTSEYNISVPSNAKYVRFSHLVDMSSYSVAKIIPLAEDLRENYAKKTDLDAYVLKSSLVIDIPNWANVSVLTNTNKFVRATNGTEGSGNDYLCSDYIDCQDIFKIHISNLARTASISTIIGVIVFYDENKTFISGVAYATGVSEYEANVPTNAKYVRFTGGTGMPDYTVSVTTLLTRAIGELNSQERVFISPAGNDANDGATEGTAVKTIARAMEISTKTLVMLQGDYDNLDFDLSIFDRIIGYGKVRIIRYRDKIDSATLASGYTKVYQATISATISSATRYLYQHDVPDAETAILASEKHPLQRNKTHRLPSTRMYKATSIADIESGTRPMWYASGTTLYFSIASGTTLASNPVIVPAGKTLSTGKKSLDIRNVAFLYTNLVLNSASGVLDNVSCGMPLPSSGVFMLDYSKTLLLRNCEAYAAFTTSGGDGFNTHTSDTSISDRSCVTFENCWSHDNSDDGESCHEHCNSIHFGGLFEYNGSGITPATGGNAQCYNVLVRRNGSHTWVEDATGTGFSAQGTDAHCQCMGCVSQNNVKGYNLSGIGSTFYAANCISQNDTTAYSSVDTTLNCMTI